ncbi:RING finger protein [Singulisphaera sp. Ch08]|uniref:RING finger protein n=1 Tax=Singulisphaera sp. Ch08 TaxID=3120278 RepID=A0AAU7CFI6_9BACT
MHLVVLGAIVLLVYLVIRLGATAGAWMTGNRYRSYRQLAARYQGKYESRGLSDPPTVSFAYKGSNVRVGLAPQITGQSNHPRTRVVARFRNGLPFRLELAPVSRPAPAQAPKGTRLVRIGDQEFDRGFVVQANDPEMAAGFLDSGVRWSIGNLQRLAPPGGMLISINPERLLVQIDRNLGLHAESLIHAVRETLLIHDGLQLGVASQLSQGVSILAVGPTSSEDAGPPICKVCGEAIDGPSVRCAVCRTPHHRDCWEYVGTCSIYGCNGKHSVSA